MIQEQEIVGKVLKRIQQLTEEPFVPIGVSNRHLHVSQTDLEVLFGKGYELTKQKDLYQPGQFAAKETVTVIGPKGTLERVRILGPSRKITQLEISLTDGFKIGITPPIRESGKIQGTPGVILEGPNGKLSIKEGVIAAFRHIHVSPEFARKFDLQDKQLVQVELEGIRKTIFDQVLIRVSDQFVEEMHLDTDEANAAGIHTGSFAKIVKGSR